MLYWITFSNPDPGEEPFLGVVIIEAESPEEALNEASLMGVNPGGYAEVYTLKEMSEMAQVLPQNRLLTSEELNAFGFFSENQKREMH